ncbi:MAG TPA: TlpA disulfide reductase family protein [Fimbriimonadaceae bacterium]|nr:TlpA disulfide reductase family protein [Fimbriimonadaceae bacterium]
MKRTLALLLAAAAVLAMGASVVGDAASISKSIGTLRSLPHDKRVELTKDLALQIRDLKPGKEKVALASGLANVSTEGDFGSDTLQEVTVTLASAVRESPPAQQENGQPARVYTTLANLARYEHMHVDLDSADYIAALHDIVSLEEERAKLDFTLTDISGKEWTLSSLKGRVVLVNFWATWCPPCRKEMPDLEVLYNRFKDQGLVVLSISDEKPETVRPYIAEHKFTYPILLDPGRKVNSAFKIDSIPKNFVYNREGRIVAQSIDMRTQEQFLKMLALAGLK